MFSSSEKVLKLTHSNVEIKTKIPWVAPPDFRGRGEREGKRNRGEEVGGRGWGREWEGRMGGEERRKGPTGRGSAPLLISRSPMFTSKSSE